MAREAVRTTLSAVDYENTIGSKGLKSQRTQSKGRISEGGTMQKGLHTRLAAERQQGFLQEDRRIALAAASSKPFGELTTDQLIRIALIVQERVAERVPLVSTHDAGKRTDGDG